MANSFAHALHLNTFALSIRLIKKRIGFSFLHEEFRIGTNLCENQLINVENELKIDEDCSIDNLTKKHTRLLFQTNLIILNIFI